MFLEPLDGTGSSPNSLVVVETDAGSKHGGRITDGGVEGRSDGVIRK